MIDNSNALKINRERRQELLAFVWCGREMTIICVFMTGDCDK